MNHKSISKLISLALRHQPKVLGLTMDDEGWVGIRELLNGLKSKGKVLSVEELQTLVKENDKQRFSFNAEFTKIRANQGHSVTVDLSLKNKKPPAILYHGTINKFLDDIKAKGLLKMKRNHVHLSQTKEIAQQVGSRRGKPVILEISAIEMQADGYHFYQSENGVWLTDQVPVNYIQF